MTDSLIYRVISPQHQSSDALIVLPNEVIAGLDDYHGARAQDVANVAGSHVLAYERPYSGADQRFSWRYRQELYRDSVKIFNQTAIQLDRAIDREGHDGLYIAGHSAATLDVVGVVATETIAFNGLVMTDPTGMRKMKRFAEVTEYGSYQLLQETRKPKNIEESYENTPNKIDISPFAFAKRMLGELIVYSAYGASPQSRNLLLDIASTQKDVGIGVVMAEHTFTLSRAEQEFLKSELEAIREENDATLSVKLLDGMYHSSFNDYKYFGRLVAAYIEQFKGWQHKTEK